MEYLALLLVGPVLWPFIAKAIWKHEITVKELTINVAIGCAVVVVGWYGARYSQMADVELLNGEVVGKESRRVSCEHSYRCNCHDVCSTDSQGRRSCTEICQTCYDHAYDVSHYLTTNLGDIEIARVDRQGLTRPPRFLAANNGDPVAMSHAYANYIKASPESLFNTLAEKSAFEQFAADIPTYPSTVYDYHYADRVLAVKANVPDLPRWNRELATMLKSVGPAKQANVVVVLTGIEDANYAMALRSAWLGGKKNDIVVVLGTPQYPSISWARVISWTDNEMFKVELTDALRDLPEASPETVLPLVAKQAMAGFERKSMKDFEYLKDSIEPSGWMLALLFVFSMVASVVTSVVLSRNNDSYLQFSRRMRMRWR
ncbi:hypothetical protein D3C71_19110 [compost metagenome]